MKTREEKQDLKMIDKTKHCCSATLGALVWFKNNVLDLTLRQGVVLIAVHQITISLFIMVVLLVAIAHVAEMQQFLHTDMEDEAERRGFYEVSYGEHLMFHEGVGVDSLNQKRFSHAQTIATMTVVVMYSVTVLTALYTVCCLALLHGAVHRKREYVLTWLVGAVIASVLGIGACVFAENYHFVVHIFGSVRTFHIFATLGLLAYMYGILCVSVFAIELKSVRHRVTGVYLGGDKGERLLLLDHAAHSNLLSSAQLDKLSRQNSLQFV